MKSSKRSDGRKNKKPWTQAEDDVLRSSRSLGEGYNATAARLPHRTFNAVVKRILYLGLSRYYRKTHRVWTTREVRLLEFLWFDKGMTHKEILRSFPGRTLKSIRNKVWELCQKLGERRVCSAKFERWVFYLTRPHVNSEVARAMGVSIHAVVVQRCRLRKMGFDVVNSDWPRPEVAR